MELQALAERRGGLDGVERALPVLVQADVVEAAAPHHAGDGVAVYDLDCLVHFEFPLSTRCPCPPSPARGRIEAGRKGVNLWNLKESLHLTSTKH